MALVAISGGVEYRMCAVAHDEFQEIVKGVAGDQIGVPQYYDVDKPGDVWPKPGRGVIVKWANH